MNNQPTAIIYKQQLLPYSETFVQNQAEALQNFQPYYVGSRILKNGLSTPKERTLVVNQGGLLGKIDEINSKIWRFNPKFIKQLINLNPVLIHAHFGSDAVIALPLSRRLNIPLLVTFHGSDITVKNQFVKPSLNKFIYFKRLKALKQEAQLFIAVSEFIKEKLIKAGFPTEKVVVHYIGIDTKQFQLNPVVQRRPLVLFVGRLIENKGCEYLIQAMSKVQAIMPEVELVVIGDGLLLPSLQQLAKKKLRRYQFLGVQPPEAVRVWMNQSKVFCVPSVTISSGASEAFGLVFAEAQAMGLPVVSFATGGVPEAVADGKTGLLTAERDSEGLAVNILRLLCNQELWQQFSQQAQERVCSLFDLQKQTQALESLYKYKVLSKSI